MLLHKLKHRRNPSGSEQIGIANECGGLELPTLTNYANRLQEEIFVNTLSQDDFDLIVDGVTILANVIRSGVKSKKNLPFGFLSKCHIFSPFAFPYLSIFYRSCLFEFY